VSGLITVSIVETIVIFRINWKKQADNARARLEIEAEETRALLDPTVEDDGNEELESERV
jgi:hypothetical protein